MTIYIASPGRWMDGKLDDLGRGRRFLSFCYSSSRPSLAYISFLLLFFLTPKSVHCLHQNHNLPNISLIQYASESLHPNTSLVLLYMHIPSDANTCYISCTRTLHLAGIWICICAWPVGRDIRIRTYAVEWVFSNVFTCMNIRILVCIHRPDQVRTNTLTM